MNGRESVNAYAEIYGLDANDDVIYDYNFRVTCKGTLELQGNSPEPPTPTPTYVYNGTGFTGDYAIMNGGYWDSGETCNGLPIYINDEGCTLWYNSDAWNGFAINPPDVEPPSSTYMESPMTVYRLQGMTDPIGSYQDMNSTQGSIALYE